MGRGSYHLILLPPSSSAEEKNEDAWWLHRNDPLEEKDKWVTIQRQTKRS